MGRIVYSPIARHRLDRALAWLSERNLSAPLLVVASTPYAGTSLLRAHAKARGGHFGFLSLTLGQLAGRLATAALTQEQRVAVDGLALSAVSARVLDQLRARGELGELSEIADRPGLQRAVTQTLRELSMANVDPVALDAHAPLLARLLAAYREELDVQQLADRSLVFDRAIAFLEHKGSRFPSRPLLLLDTAITCEAERRLCAALIARSKPVLCTVPAGDPVTRDALQTLLDETAEEPHLENLWDNALARMQHHLFEGDAPKGKQTDDVELFSAPGESREAVEIARRIQQAARTGTRFDQIAVLLRTPERYRSQLTEAFARANIPAHFTQGILVPDPAGRALLSLLRCKAEHLSAERFAEYLSLGVTPNAQANGSPPLARSSAERWVAPDSELTRAGSIEESTPPTDDELLNTLSTDAPVAAGTLRAPWRWERVLVNAAVIGGRDRWQRRLDGMQRSLEQTRVSHAEPAAQARAERALGDLASLRAFALPLIEQLDALPTAAAWGVWIDVLSALATRTLRDPEHVIAMLHELTPMANIGPVSLQEVELLLRKRLAELCVRPTSNPLGKVLVASVEEARGLSFEMVFVPGLAEKMFPQKVREDPLLLDALRRSISPALVTNHERVARERLALRIAVGAASQRLVLSFPRVDTDKGRPRVPSFYGLEAMQAVTGQLPSFDALMRDAEVAGQARMGMPAPRHVADAIDPAEFDLAVLQDFIGRDRAESIGAAHYLLGANPHLARSLRARARRWGLTRFTQADGLVGFGPVGKAAIAAHRLDARAYSASALQSYAACPYRFALRAIFGLSPRETVEAIETLDPMQRGMMIHRAQFVALTRLRETNQLPVTDTDLTDAMRIVDEALDTVVTRMHEDLAPAIERVWNDGVALVRADLREWVRRMTETDWTPERFELAFGIELTDELDPASTREPVVLDVGIRLRGAIDLVEMRGNERRATDHKTGRVATRPSVIIAGGTTLQPLLYALALEKLLPNATITAGRLYYCTVRTGFEQHVIPLDEQARASVKLLAETLGDSITEPFLPAAPDRDECGRCDYAAVCGPYEELRVRRKDERKLRRLRHLRELL